MNGLDLTCPVCLSYWQITNKTSARNVDSGSLWMGDGATHLARFSLERAKCVARLERGDENRQTAKQTAF